MNKDLDIFKLFKKYTDKIIDEQGTTIEVSKILELEVAFLKFSIKTYPQNIDYVNEILESCINVLNANKKKDLTNEGMKLLVKLLSIPLDSLSLHILGMNQFPKLMGYLKFQQRKTVAFRIVKAVIKARNLLTSKDTIEQLLFFVNPLLQDLEDTEDSESVRKDVLTVSMNLMKNKLHVQRSHI